MFQREFETNLTVRILLALPLPVIVHVFAHKKNAKEKVFDTKERSVAPWKPPKILRIKKQRLLRFNTMLPSYAVDHSDCGWPTFYYGASYQNPCKSKGVLPQSGFAVRVFWPI